MTSESTLLAAVSGPTFTDLFSTTTATQWFVAAAIVVVAAVIPAILRPMLLARLGPTPGPQHTPRAVLAGVVRALSIPLFVVVGVWVASLALPLPDAAAFLLKIAGVAAIALQFVFVGIPLVDAGLSLIASRAAGDNAEQNETIVSSMGVLRFLGIALLAAVTVLVALDNLNVAVTPLLTGLGIGGIAVALAAQNILGDLFASASILLDKPFMVGDFIIVGDKMGVVERIGVKTTRVRALSGEQLIFANSDLLAARIQNFKRMQERRASFTVGVVYDTSIEKLRAIPAIVKSIIESREGLRFDRCVFRTLNAYSLDFEAVFYVNSPDMLFYLAHQQEINLQLVEEFRSRGIEFAFPTQVEIQVESPPKRA
jgi:small-conductance mechanosensitive channel